MGIRKPLTPFRGVLLALPIVYLLASGPLLRVSADHPTRKYSEAFYKPWNRATGGTKMNSLWRNYLGWWGGYFTLEVFDNVRITKP